MSRRAEDLPTFAENTLAIAGENVTELLWLQFNKVISALEGVLNGVEGICRDLKDMAYDLRQTSRYDLDQYNVNCRVAGDIDRSAEKLRLLMEV